MESLLKASSQILRPAPGNLRSEERPKWWKSVGAIGMEQLKGSAIGLFDPKLYLLPLPTKHTMVSVPKKEKSSHGSARRLERGNVRYGQSVDILASWFNKILLDDWPDELLADDVVFLDGITPHFGFNAFHAFGKQKYNALMQTLRFYVYLLCKQTKARLFFPFLLFLV